MVSLRLTQAPAWTLGVLTMAAIAACGASLPGSGVSGQTIATVAAVGLAAFMSALAGFAFSAICGAMLFQFRNDTVSVVQVLLLCSVANQALSVWALRDDIDWRALRPFLLGGTLGVPCGVWLLLHLEARGYVAGLGGLLVAYGLYMLVRPPVRLRQPSPAADIAAAFLGGMAGGFAASPGTVLAIWCSAKDWDKTRQRALFQPYILVLQLLALATIAVLRPPTLAGGGIPLAVWACVPVGMVGTLLGLACFRRLTDRQFGLAINLLLIASGAGLAL